MNKIIAILSFIVVSLLFSCNNSSSSDGAVANDEISGYQIYKINCQICHGSDGRMGLNGAKIIPDSKLSLEERIIHISNGKGAMQPYKGVLSDAKIKAVAEYTMTLGKD